MGQGVHDHHEGQNNDTVNRGRGHKHHSSASQVGPASNAASSRPAHRPSSWLGRYSLCMPSVFRHDNRYRNQLFATVGLSCESFSEARCSCTSSITPPMAKSTGPG